MKLQKLIPVSVLGIAALALAGCGVFDGDDDDNGPSITQSQLDAAIAATATAEGRVTTLEGRVTTLEGELATAMAELEGAEATDDQEAVEGLRDKVTRLQGELATVQGELAQFKLDAANLLTKAEKDERIAREAMIRAAILVTDNRAGTSANPFPSGITEQAVTRDADGTLTVDVNGVEMDDEYMGGEGTAGSDAWNSVILTKTDALGTEDTVVFYTDISAPADTLLTDRYPQTELDDALHEDRVEKVQSDGFPSDPGTTYMYTGLDGERSKSVEGTFDGVPGQFTCITTACTVMADGMGDLATSEGWRFTPNSPNTATFKDPDVSYAYFGWWLNKPEANDDMHDVEVFAGGTTDHETAVTVAMEGNATYSGPAAGKYVTKSYTAGAHSDSGVGHFTARANLTAKFGDDSGPEGTIEGTVTNFMLDDTSPVSWSVTLEEATLNNTANFNGNSEVNFGGGLTEDDAGTWQGSFYDADDDAAAAPGTVAGTFDAVTDAAAVIGAFGATK